MPVALPLYMTVPRLVGWEITTTSHLGAEREWNEKAMISVDLPIVDIHLLR